MESIYVPLLEGQAPPKTLQEALKILSTRVDIQKITIDELSNRLAMWQRHVNDLSIKNEHLVAIIGVFLGVDEPRKIPFTHTQFLTLELIRTGQYGK